MRSCRLLACLTSRECITSGSPWWQVPWAAAGGLAEEATGVPSADLRFHAMTPISAARQATWTRTARFIGSELVGSGATEISPLLAGEMTRLAAAALLETSPTPR